MHIFTREDHRSIPFVPDVLAPDFQEPFSRLLSAPENGWTLVWDHGQDIGEVAMPPVAIHLRPVLQRIVTVGDVATRSEDDFLMIGINQKAANQLSPGLGWHKDAFGWDYKRAAVSDIFGPMYKTPRGKMCYTPDYGILVLDANAEHAPHESRNGRVRTRILVSRMAISARASYAADFYSDMAIQTI